MQTSQEFPTLTSTSPAVEDLPTPVRIARGLAALVRLGQDPNDTEQALNAAVLLNAPTLQRMVARMEADASGRALLQERPALDAAHIDLPTLAALPLGSFGRSYHTFMSERGLTPDVFVPPASVRDDRTRYLAQRVRQTHDLWHVLTGYNTDTLGEVELQAFTYGQLRMPFSLLVALLGLVRVRPLSLSTPRRVWDAYRRGCRAPLLLVEPFERSFAAPLRDVQAKLGLA